MQSLIDLRNNRKKYSLKSGRVWQEREGLEYMIQMHKLLLATPPWHSSNFFADFACCKISPFEKLQYLKRAYRYD